MPRLTNYHKALSFIAVFAVSIFFVSAVSAEPTLQINRNNQHAEIEGFGSWSDQFTLNHAGDLPSDLDIEYMRFTVGTERPWSFPSIEPSNDNNDPYNINWSNFEFDTRWDENLSIMRQLHQSRGIKFTPSMWFYPEWMVEYSGDWENKRLRPGMENEAAEHIAAFLLYAKQHYGLDEDAIPTISVANEPAPGAYWKWGWRISGDALHDMIRATGEMFEHHNIQTKIVAPTTPHPSEMVSMLQPTLDDPVARSYLGAVDFHSYTMTSGHYEQALENVRNVRERMSHVGLNLPIYDSEMAGYCREPHTWYYAWEMLIQYIYLLREDVSMLIPNIGDNNCGDRYGGERGPRSYIFEHFFNHLPVGSRRVDADLSVTDNNIVSAAYFTPTGSIVIHIVNKSSSSKPLRISGLSGFDSARRYKTDQSQQTFVDMGDMPISSGSLNLTLTPRSITTLVTGEGGAPPPIECGNGTIEEGEQCDDGNIQNGDGCSSECVLEELTFALITDFGVDNIGEERVANRVKSWDPHIVVTSGDNRQGGGCDYTTYDRRVGKYYEEFIKPYNGQYGSGSSDINRFFPALGNHDYDECSGNPTAYLDFFDLGNDRYYDFTFGPVHFFMVNSDTHEPDGTSANSTQGQWLQNALQSSEMPLKVVSFHHSPYSSGGHGSITYMQWPFDEWGVDVVITGHNHIYERVERDDVTYVVAGTGGGAYRECGNPIPGSQVCYPQPAESPEYGAMLVDVDDTDAIFQYVTHEGDIIDEFVIELDGGQSQNNPPNVDIITPENGDIVSGDVPVEADAWDDDPGEYGEIDYVQFYINDVPYHRDWDLPYTYLWETEGGEFPNGTYNVRAKACDNGGLCSNDTVTVEVNNSAEPNEPPVIAIPYPAAHSVVSGTASYVVAYITDSDGDEIDHATLFVDGDQKQILTDPVGPGYWVFVWDTTTVGNGERIITVTAEDDRGAVGSIDHPVIVENGTGIPTCEIVTPQDGQTISGDSVLISASADDPDGILYVDFWLNDQALNRIYHPLSGYYSFLFDTTEYSNGTYTLKALALDKKGIWSQPHEILVNIYNINTSQPEIFTDDFEDGNADGWTPDHPDHFDIANDNGNLVYSSLMTAAGWSSAGDENWSDYVYQAKIKKTNSFTFDPDGRWVGLEFYYTAENQHYTFKHKGRNAGYVELSRSHPQGGGVLTYTPYTMDDDVWYNFKVEARTLANEIALIGKIWREDQNEADATILMHEDTSSQRIERGKIGVVSRRDKHYYDDVVVTEN